MHTHTHTHTRMHTILFTHAFRTRAEHDKQLEQIEAGCEDQSSANNREGIITERMCDVKERLREVTASTWGMYVGFVWQIDRVSKLRLGCAWLQRLDDGTCAHFSLQL